MTERKSFSAVAGSHGVVTSPSSASFIPVGAYPAAPLPPPAVEPFAWHDPSLAHGALDSHHHHHHHHHHHSGGSGYDSSSSYVYAAPGGMPAFTPADLPTDGAVWPPPSSSGDGSFRPAGSFRGPTLFSGTPSTTASPPTSPQHRTSRSVVDGLTMDELLARHRQSLAGIATVDAAGPLDGLDLSSITLSKRHTFTRDQYDAGREAAAFDTLAKYEGFAEEPFPPPPE